MRGDIRVDIKPVNKYRQPRYPDKLKVLSNPGALKNLPDRWKYNVQVGAALSTLLILTLTACERKGETGPVGVNVKAEVAPIFEHGSGRGSFGCVSIAPPAFLSEEEAFKVIQEEGKRYGINFKTEGFTVSKVKIPETSFQGKVTDSRTGNLELDGYDSGKKVGVEFISEEDYKKWASGGSTGLVDNYDFLSAAKELRQMV